MNESALPELPVGWVWTRVGDIIIKISNGISERQINEKSNIMVTRIETISKGFIDLNKVGYLKDLSPQEIEKYTLLQDDILFSNINSDSHLGKTAIFSFDSITLLHGMNLLLIRSNRECINPKLLHYLCNYYRFSGTFISIAQHAVNQSSINQSKLNNLPIPLPPLPEQSRIVTKLEELFTRLDAGVSELKKTQAQLKRYRSSVLKAACEGKLVPTEAELAKAEGHTYEPADVLLARILKERRQKWNGKGKYKEPATSDISRLPELPEGWCWVSAEQLTTVITDGEHITPERSESGVLLLSARNVLDGKLSLRDVDYVPQHVYNKLSQRLKIEPGDVLLSCSGSVGRSCVAPEGLTFSLVRSVAVLKPVIKAGNYLSYCLRSHILQSQIIEKKTQTAQANIFQGKIKSLKFPLPPLAEQQRIVLEVERRLSIADGVEKTVEQSLAQAERLRQSILKRAFEGRLVAQDAGDEPAGVLLERIKAEKMRTGNGTKKSKQIKLSIKDVA